MTGARGSEAADALADLDTQIARGMETALEVTLAANLRLALAELARLRGELATAREKCTAAHKLRKIENDGTNEEFAGYQEHIATLTAELARARGEREAAREYLKAGFAANVVRDILGPLSQYPDKDKWTAAEKRIKGAMTGAYVSGKGDAEDEAAAQLDADCLRALRAVLNEQSLSKNTRRQIEALLARTAEAALDSLRAREKSGGE